MAAGAYDGAVHLFDVSDPAAPHRIARLGDGSGKKAGAAVFSPDGTTLAVGGVNGEVLLWNVRDPSRPHWLGPPTTAATGRVYALAFHPSGRPTGDMLVAGGADQTIRTWRTDPESVITTLCHNAGDPITEHEWNTYLNGVPFQQPC